MAQSRIREILEFLKARYPAASEEELADRFMEKVAGRGAAQGCPRRGLSTHEHWA